MQLSLGAKQDRKSLITTAVIVLLLTAIGALVGLTDWGVLRWAAVAGATTVAAYITIYAAVRRACADVIFTYATKGVQSLRGGF